MFTCLRVKIFSQVFLNFQVKKNEKKWKFVKFNQIFLNPTSGMPGPIHFLFGLENDIWNQSGRFITGVAIVNIFCFVIECVYASLFLLLKNVYTRVWCMVLNFQDFVFYLFTLEVLSTVFLERSCMNNRQYYSCWLKKNSILKIN